MPVSQGVALCSSVFANALTTCATFPLDTIKTRQQTSSARPNFTKGLLRGLTPTVLITTPAVGLYFTIFETLQKRNTTQSLSGDIACACAAQVLPGAIVIPCDILKVNLQAGTYPNAPAALRATFQQVHWRQTLMALRHRLLLSYGRDFSFATIQMTLYVNLRRQGDTMAMLAGPIAAGTASLITTPLDTLRTRHLLAADSGLKTSAMAEANYFAGLVPRVMLSALAGFIFFRTYEKAKPVMRRWLETTEFALQ